MTSGRHTSHGLTRTLPKSRRRRSGSSTAWSGTGELACLPSGHAKTSNEVRYKTDCPARSQSIQRCDQASEDHSQTAVGSGGGWVGLHGCAGAAQCRAAGSRTRRGPRHRRAMEYADDADRVAVARMDQCAGFGTRTQARGRCRSRAMRVRPAAGCGTGRVQYERVGQSSAEGLTWGRAASSWRRGRRRAVGAAWKDTIRTRARW